MLELKWGAKGNPNAKYATAAAVGGLNPARLDRLRETQTVCHAAGVHGFSTAVSSRYVNHTTGGLSHNGTRHLSFLQPGGAFLRPAL